MKSYIIHCAIFVLTIVVYISGCKYSNIEVSQVISSEVITENVETESLEVPVLENTETEQPRPYEVKTIALEDIASESILCTDIFEDTAEGCKDEELYNRYRDIIAECEKGLGDSQNAVMLLDSGDSALKDSAIKWLSEDWAKQAFDSLVKTEYIDLFNNIIFFYLYYSFEKLDF